VNLLRPINADSYLDILVTKKVAKVSIQQQAVGLKEMPNRNSEIPCGWEDVIEKLDAGEKRFAS
jgi:hypothetical protein